MTRLKMWIIGLLLLVPIAASCQTGTARINVVDRSRLRVEISPSEWNAAIGDTLTFTAVVRDTVSNNIVPVVLSWSGPPGLVVNSATGHVRATAAGSYTLTATYVRLISMRVWEVLPNGNAREVYVDGGNENLPRFAINVGEQRKLCVVFVDEFGRLYTEPPQIGDTVDCAAAITGVTFYDIRMLG